MERTANRIERAAAVLVLALVFAFLLMLCVSAFLGTAQLTDNDFSGEHIEFLADNVFLNGILLGLVLMLLYLFHRHEDSWRLRRMESVLMLWIFLLGTAWIASVKLRAPIYSDSFLVTNAAQRAALGDFAPFEDDYFRRFPFQLGYVLYSELFFRAANFLLRGTPEGYKVLALQELNLLWLLFSLHALIECCGLIFPDPKAKKLTVLLMFFCLPPVLSCTFLYGNIPAYACGMGALWLFLLFLRDGRLRHGLLCALLLGLGVMLKLNLLIFCVAIGGVWLLELLRRRSLRSFICLLLAVACVFAGKSLPQRVYEQRTGLRFGEGIPMLAWMAMGFSEGYAAPGWYRTDNTVDAFEESGNDPAATAAHAKVVLRERAAYFSSWPRAALRFFSEKLRSQWNEPSCQSLWINEVHLSYSEKNGIYRIFCDSGHRRTLGYMNHYQQLIYLGALLGAVLLWKKRRLPNCTLALIVLGGVLYHMLFEAKSQYALPYFMLLLPMAGAGLTALFRKVDFR